MHLKRQLWLSLRSGASASRPRLASSMCRQPLRHPPSGPGKPALLQTHRGRALTALEVAPQAASPGCARTRHVSPCRRKPRPLVAARPSTRTTDPGMCQQLLVAQVSNLVDNQTASFPLALWHGGDAVKSMLPVRLLVQPCEESWWHRSVEK
jgi:hypothetical protein